MQNGHTILVATAASMGSVCIFRLDSIVLLTFSAIRVSQVRSAASPRSLPAAPAQAAPAPAPPQPPEQTAETTVEPPAEDAAGDPLLRIVGEEGEQTDGAIDREKDLQDKLLVTMEEIESNRMTTDAIESRLARLEAEIDRMQQLVELKDAQIAALQSEVETRDALETAASERSTGVAITAVLLGLAFVGVVLLTGLWRQDAGSALQIGCYNARRGDLDQRLMDIAGLSTSFVAPMRRGHEVNGLSRKGARLTGLEVRRPHRMADEQVLHAGADIDENGARVGL